MEIIIVGLLVNVLTWISEKTKLSQTYIAVILAVVLGGGYYIATTYYAIERQKMLEFVGGVYASSQLVYNLMKKFGILDRINKG